MSICDNFEGALMKALRSLEQHIDSLDIGRYSDRSKEELLERIHIVDDRRIFIIAELIRKGATYEEIHDITKIDMWFIDKIAHLVEMEQTLKNETLTPEILAEAKRMEFPDAVIANYTGMTEREIHDMRHKMELLLRLRWLIPVRLSLRQVRHIITACLAAKRKFPKIRTENESWFLVPVQSESVRVSSLTSVRFTVYGHWQRAAMRQLL